MSDVKQIDSTNRAGEFTQIKGTVSEVGENKRIVNPGKRTVIEDPNNSLTQVTTPESTVTTTETQATPARTTSETVSGTTTVTQTVHNGVRTTKEDGLTVQSVTKDDIGATITFTIQLKGGSGTPYQA